MFVILSVIISSVILYPIENTSIPAASEIKSTTTIIIDPGHGGEDCGAIGYDNILEKDLNMAISMKLGDYLKAAGYTVVFTRTEDKLLYKEEENIKGMRKFYDLKNRVNIANSYDNYLFVSIHMNFYGAPESKGLQVYYSTKNEQSRIAAEKIQNAVVSKIQPSNKRKIKAGNDLYILENATDAAVLIECGFLSNPDECKKLSEKEYQKELCFAILCGIIDYMNSK